MITNRQLADNSSGKLTKNILISYIFDNYYYPVYTHSCLHCPLHDFIIDSTLLGRARRYCENYVSVYTCKCGAYFDGANFKPTSYCIAEPLIFSSAGF